MSDHNNKARDRRAKDLGSGITNLFFMEDDSIFFILEGG